MLFNSTVFWIFFAVVLAVYWRLPHRRQNQFLLVASYVFYGAWDWRFLSLIGISTIVDYIAARRIVASPHEKNRKRFLLLSVAVNLGLLGVFKYFGFFTSQFNALLAAVGMPDAIPFMKIVLPVGISFYTFQTMSYTIDVYRGDTKPVDSLLDFALYVSFFPQLVAGPIERSTSFLPQVVAERTASKRRFLDGLHMIVMGLFKKVVLADNMAPIVNAVFAKDLGQLSGPECVVGIYAFAFQIYGDFSGYSSIAKGVAKWMGFDLRTNFRLPYIAQSPQEFWRRWHISLSTWLRDYLYIPLGGGRGSRLFTYRNLMLTMVLGGLWHGAAWTFVVWGIYHGALLSAHRLFRHRFAAPERPSAVVQLLNMVVMFQFTCLGWLIFRAESVRQIGAMLAAMFTKYDVSGFARSGLGLVAFYAVPLFAYEAWMHVRNKDADDTVRGALPVHAVMYAYFAAMLMFFPPPVAHEFIYFRF